MKTYIAPTNTMNEFRHSGHIELEDPIDLETTLESGQTFLWTREDAEMFQDEKTTGSPVYSTARRLQSEEIMVIRVSGGDNSLEWESTHAEAEEYLQEIFRLDEDHDQIRLRISENDPAGVIEEATTAYPGLRVVNEPLFPTLISFICSAAAEVAWIHELVQRLCDRYGDEIEVAGDTYAAFPTVSQLSNVTEKELKEQRYGLRAKRIAKTVTAISTDDIPLEPLPAELEEARNHLQNYYGVGRKVASCVLLYAGCFDTPFPVDTQIEQAIKHYYPSLAELSKEEMGLEFENMFGEYAGYAQMYLYHYQRSRSDD